MKIKNVYFLIIIFITTFALTAFMINNNAKHEKVIGFGILNKLPGIWHGPVFSDTPAGSFNDWFVDFRPISEGEITQFTTFNNDIKNYLSFFIVEHDNQLKVAMRTEGVMNGKGCVTYEVIDSVDEKKGYYRFSDFCRGTERAYTTFKFKNNKFIMEVYTNKFNTKNKLSLHSRWNAKLVDRKSAKEAIVKFNFPQNKMIKDFSECFKNKKESIYYTFENDPYKSGSQTYTSELKVNIKIDDKLKVKKTNELFLLLTTKSLFEGIKYKAENLKYISRYVYLPADVRTFTFSDIHPGTYYLYSYNDLNNDKKHKKGDYMSSNVQHKIEIKPESKKEVKSTIDMIIP